MIEIFEDKFMDLQADMVSVCLEYVDSKAEKIYIYASHENNSFFFNLFFQINGYIKRLNSVNDVLSESDKIDASVDRQWKVLDIGMEDLHAINTLCEENNRDMPTEFKLIFDVEKGSLETNYQYEPVWADTKDKTDHNIFISWYEEVKNEVEG